MVGIEPTRQHGRIISWAWQFTQNRIILTPDSHEMVKNIGETYSSAQPNRMIDLPIRSYDLGSVVLNEHRTYVHTWFRTDESTNVFEPPVTCPDFLAAAHEMGYSDPMRYAVEHELSHHVSAFDRGLEYSPVVWDAAHGVEMSIEEPDRAWEETVTNRMQLFMNTGQKDPWGILDEVYGDRLPAVASRLLRIARPWLELK